MKKNKIDLSDILDVLDQAEQFRPLVKKMLKVFKSYGPEISKVIDDLIDYSVKRNTKTFNMYLKEGFTREEAMLFLLNSKIALENAINNTNRSKKC